MTPDRKSAKCATHAAGLAVGIALALGSIAPANARRMEKCTTDLVQQSVCVYRAILSDIAESYSPPSGGGINSVVRTSQTTLTVEMLQEGRIDILNYTVKIGPDGKVDVVGKSVHTRTMGER